MTTTITLAPAPDGAEAFVHLVGILTGQPAATARCTCCEEPRLVYRYGGEREEWGHVDDQHFAEVRHIHVDSSARDCDGRYDRGHTVRLNSGIADWALRPGPKSQPQEIPTWHDLVTYMFRHEVGIWSGVSTVEIDAYGGTMRWSTVTEEGGEGGELRVCDDPSCAYDESKFRDHTAEAAGY